MSLSNCVVQKVSKNMILNKYIEEISNTKKQTNKNSRDNDDSNCMQPASLWLHTIIISTFLAFVLPSLLISLLFVVTITVVLQKKAHGQCTLHTA